MTITVIIPTYLRPEYLKRCLQSMEKQTRPADCILIVAQATDAASRAVATDAKGRGFPIEILDAPAGGVRAALNLAFDRAKTEIIVATDDDAEAYPGWLALIEKHFLDDPTLGGVGGRDELQYADRPDLSSPKPTNNIGIFTAMGKMHGSHHHPPISDRLEVNVLKGVNMALRREALGDIRIDDTLRGNFAQVGWEIILSFQLRAQGWKLIFDKQLPIKHWVGPRPPEDLRTAQALQAGADSIFNTIYATVSYGPLLRSKLMIVRALLIGSRFEPGILGAFYLTAKGDFAVWARFRNQFIPRLTGYFTGLGGWIKNPRRLWFSWPKLREA